MMMPKFGLDARGEKTWITIVFLLLLYAYINLTAFGLGHFLVQYLDFPLLQILACGDLTTDVGPRAMLL